MTNAEGHHLYRRNDGLLRIGGTLRQLLVVRIGECVAPCDSAQNGTNAMGLSVGAYQVAT